MVVAISLKQQQQQQQKKTIVSPDVHNLLMIALLVGVR